MGKGKRESRILGCRGQAWAYLYEMAGVEEDVAKEAFRLASHKLSVPTRFVVNK